MKSKAFGDFF